MSLVESGETFSLDGTELNVRPHDAVVHPSMTLRMAGPGLVTLFRRRVSKGSAKCLKEVPSYVVMLKFHAAVRVQIKYGRPQVQMDQAQGGGRGGFTGRGGFNARGRGRGGGMGGGFGYGGGMGMGMGMGMGGGMADYYDDGSGYGMDAYGGQGGYGMDAYGGYGMGGGMGMAGGMGMGGGMGGAGMSMVPMMLPNGQARFLLCDHLVHDIAPLAL